MGGTVVLLSWADAVDIGHGRGRAARPAASSIRRIDRQLGRPADVNEAWRSPEVANENRRKWLAFQNGTGPRAPYALPAEESIHCRGFAADSDDWYDPAAAAVWYDNGWRQTARYPGTARDEPWHGEYFQHLDNHRHEPAGLDSDLFEPEAPKPKEIDMIVVHAKDLMPNWRFVLAPGFIKNVPGDQGQQYAAATSQGVNEFDNAWMVNIMWTHGLAEVFDGTPESLKAFLQTLSGGGFYVASWLRGPGAGTTTTG